MLVCTLLLLLLGRRALCGDPYVFSLSIRDRLHPDWVTEDLRPVTRTECAALCFRKLSCTHFGFLLGRCLLLTHDLGGCAEEECPSEPGMKIYELKQEIVSTSSTTTTDVTTVTVTTEAPLITTTELETTTETTTSLETTTETTTPSETTTEATTPSQTTTETTTPSQTTTETTTLSETTTETTTSTVTTTETTTAVETTTETTTSSETTSALPTTTTSTTTTEGPTTTTTVQPETTETTTAGTTTTTEASEFSCEPPDGATASVECPMDTLLPNALGSKSPFFGDALSPKCYDFKENLYDASKEEIYYFFSLDGGITIKAQCEREYDVIVSYKLCVKDAHIPAIVIHCCPIKDTGRVERIFNATSEVWKDALVDCDSKAAFQKMFMTDSDGKGVITRVIYQCVLFDVPDNEVDSALGDNKPATG